ncbi:hypothetical protein PHYBLDRAFT_165341 [Phycomyces blakesleeanus NRRL 1555(-)]|uniref:Uncharacterized protein n=1 Tax=Phycomyces blakesleeanus (strain ATCC 8743b / DSM 1359 / FGSC 10004 / NBRC 33097 / NRRL 1555) TaxID=763407 RepID=A0A167NXR6_PHYB8|nr:hypothetical protein PHYBLDRAFT_165341 [Phycomyces blakesleeanus NRRL 1555(-)]OAD76839.1 hypothetical protein PHYBLDRAFT_165341 [Phycomyces blakesleeanus NRRL 1555(-)]|eukprot:XP_018294879.1 hypothetical protein PHYBLDRAFT_165341 [Phycomyces blakesleeanus NRRL 1555(-)]
MNKQFQEKNFRSYSPLSKNGNKTSSESLTSSIPSPKKSWKIWSYLKPILGNSATHSIVREPTTTMNGRTEQSSIASTLENVTRPMYLQHLQSKDTTRIQKSYARWQVPLLSYLKKSRRSSTIWMKTPRPMSTGRPLANEPTDRLCTASVQPKQLMMKHVSGSKRLSEFLNTFDMPTKTKTRSWSLLPSYQSTSRSPSSNKQFLPEQQGTQEIPNAFKTWAFPSMEGEMEVDKDEVVVPSSQNPDYPTTNQHLRHQRAPGQWMSSTFPTHLGEDDKADLATGGSPGGILNSIQTGPNSLENSTARDITTSNIGFRQGGPEISVDPDDRGVA